MPAVHAVASPTMYTRRDPYVNLLRGTVAGFAAGVGGADAVTVAPFDAALGSSTPFSRRIARNTQSLLVMEAHLARVIDPAGGSWFVESLTDELARAAWAFFQELEAAGGVVAALDSGLVADRTAAVRAGREKEAATRRAPVTGVSEFPDLHEKPVPRSGPDLLAAPGPGSGRAGLPVYRPAAAYEAFRDRSDAHLAATGARPRAFLATLGPLATHAARAGFTRNLLHAGGIDTVDAGPTEAVDDVVAAFRDAGTPVAVLCSSDALYAERAAPVVAGLRAAGARHVLLAGKARVDGVDGHLAAGGDALAVLGGVYAAHRPEGGRPMRFPTSRPFPSTPPPRRPASTPGRPRSADGGEPPAWDSPEGIGIRPLYTADDTAGLDFLGTYPGIAPFLRGPYPTMYTSQPWTVRQYAGFSTAEESNAFYRRNLAAGQKGLSIAFDLATHRGYDSDHPRVAGDVGMAGVAIDSIYDMRQLFDGIPLDTMSVSMTMNGAVLPVLALYVVAAEEQGVAARPAHRDHPERHPQGVHGPQHLHLPARAVDADHLRHLRATPRGRCRSSTRSPSPATTSRRRGRPPTWSWPTPSPTAWSTCGPGSTPGLDVDAFAPRLSFFWAIGMNFFMEVAKLRAARLLWAKLLRQFAPKNAKSLSLRTHCQTSGWSLTAQDVFNNVVRTCVEAMAATQGHTQSLHTNALDEALALPTDFSARIARNTQLLLQQESGTTKVIDPWGGSHYVERLTYDLARRAWAHITEVEKAGGMAAGDRRGHPEAARRGGRRAHPGADRLRAPAGDRGQQVRHRLRRGDRRPQGRQRRRPRAAAGQAAPAARGARPARRRRRPDRR